MSNICEENEFVLANFYEQVSKTDKMSCQNQPYVVNTSVENIESFQKASIETLQYKG
jgi:hypothetical protein